MYGAAIIGWSSREIVPNVWIEYPYNEAENREEGSLRSLKAELGHGFMGMAKVIEHSKTAVMCKERKGEWYASYQKVGWQVISV